MRKRCIAAALAAAFTAGLFAAGPASAGSGVNVGSLNCKVAGGSGFIFGSTKSLSCLFTRTDGTHQWAYDGKPLYLYDDDDAPGDMEGDGAGGVWHVVK